MMLEPEVLAHLEAANGTAIDYADVPSLRKRLAEEIDRTFTLFGLPGPDVEKVLDHEVPVEGGTILVRSYHPQGARLLPAHVIVHGGGWTTGSINELVADATARHRAVGADCVAVLVEYRLAPEHPFPTPLNDVVAAVLWVQEHAAELAVDRHAITLGGSSAGANLSAAAVLAEPALDVQALLLEVPALDLRDGAAVVPRDLGGEYDDLLVPTIDMYESAVRDYLSDPVQTVSPLVSPTLAEDLAVFPETFILTAQLDALRPSAEKFAARLSAAGVPVTITRYDGALHGSPILTRSWATARRWHEDTLAILRDIHRRATVAS